MTGRERIALALAHRETDRVPYDQSSRSSAIEEEPYRNLTRCLGLDLPTRCFIRAHAEIDEPVRCLLGIDTEFIRHFLQPHWKSEGKDALFIDAWQVPWRRKAGTLYYELDKPPHAGLDYETILKQRWNPLITPETAEALHMKAAELHNNHDSALFSDQIGAGIFERAWYLRGLEEFLVDIMLDKPHVHRYLEKILEHQLEGYTRLFDAIGTYIFGVIITDDFAAQESLLISRELYREMIFPYHRRMLEFFRSHGIQVIFHSCGAIAPLIPDLLDAGVEILHPIQHTAAGMNLAALKREYGQDLVLWGGGCDTALLQRGSPAEIRDDVHRTLEILGREGGFVYTTTHCIQPGTPPENILAMAETIKGLEPGTLQEYCRDVAGILQER